jgi:hypothetical protein
VGGNPSLKDTDLRAEGRACRTSGVPGPERKQLISFYHLISIKSHIHKNDFQNHMTAERGKTLADAHNAHLLVPCLFFGFTDFS